eukprot:jgi/Mesvir1/262/Mv13600-RA.1
MADLTSVRAWDSIAEYLDPASLHEMFRATCFSHEWSHVAGIMKVQRASLYNDGREEFQLPHRLVDITENSAEFRACVERFDEMIRSYRLDPAPRAQKLDRLVHACLPRPGDAERWTTDHHKALQILQNIETVPEPGVGAFDSLTKSFDLIVNNTQVHVPLWLFMNAFGQAEGLEYYTRVLTVCYFAEEPVTIYKRWTWVRLVTLCVSINKDNGAGRRLRESFQEGQRYFDNPRSSGMRRDTAMRALWRKGINFRAVRLPDEDYMTVVRDVDTEDLDRWMRIQKARFDAEFERYKRQLLLVSSMLKRSVSAKMACAAFEFDKKQWSMDYTGVVARLERSIFPAADN